MQIWQAAAHAFHPTETLPDTLNTLVSIIRQGALPLAVCWARLCSAQLQTSAGCSPGLWGSSLAGTGRSDGGSMSANQSMLHGQQCHLPDHQSTAA